MNVLSKVCNFVSRLNLTVLSSIQLETKSDTELFELMTHREEVMRSRALLIIFNKIRGAGVAKSQQQVTPLAHRVSL